MVTCLFWNTNRKRLEAEIRALVDAHQVDIIIVSEFPGSAVSMLQSLNQAKPEFHYAVGQCTRVQVFTRFSPAFLRPAYETNFISVRRLRLPARLEILLVAAHLPSKLYQSEHSQAFECVELARTIRDQEQMVGHSRTLVVGDLNMNPFEEGLVAANGLNAVMSRQIAARGSRNIHSQEYPFFFNPMWSHLGDHVSRPPGTYYYERSELVNYYWNLFDQVLVRPDLMGRLNSDSIKVLTEVGGASLLREEGRPNHRKFSDHLPLLFGIEL